MGWTQGDRRREAINPIDIGIIVTGAAIIGARAAFVGAHWSYFAEHITKAFWIWDGGLSWIGAFLGILLALLLITIIRSEPLGELADHLAVPIAILAIAAWLGCFLDGCAYGREFPYKIDLLTTPDIFGVRASRWPTQALGVLYGGVVTLILLYVEPRALPGGSKFLIALALLSAGMVGLTLVRGDPLLQIAGIRLDTLAAIGILVGSIVVLGTLLIRKKGD